jgi:hypothetical protein
MKPVQSCSICGGAIVGFGNDAWPVNDRRCCDQCNAEGVIPALRLLERDTKREGSNGSALLVGKEARIAESAPTRRGVRAMASSRIGNRSLRSCTIFP